MEKYINCLSYIVYTMTKIKPAVASSKDHHDYKWHCNFHLDAVVFDNLFGENISATSCLSFHDRIISTFFLV